jgi:hypothetical protein
MTTNLKCIILFIIKFNGIYSAEVFNQTGCFRHHIEVCDTTTSTGLKQCQKLIGKQSPIYCDEKQETCYSLDHFRENPYVITQIKSNLEINIKCGDKQNAMIQNVSMLYATKPVNICKNNNCTNVNSFKCETQECICDSPDNYDVCEEPLNESIEKLNKMCSLKHGSCMITVQRSMMKHCTTSGCQSSLNANFTFCYSQWARVWYTCINGNYP